MKKKYYIRPFIFIAVVLVAAMFYTLPYYVSKPGMAQELEPIIKVENGFDEKGNFMLTTVRMGRANIYSYVAAKIGKYQEIYPLDMILNGEETEEEYATRQLHLMESSKLNAIEVAYQKAGLPVDYRYLGVYVLNVLPDMPAYEKLIAGDRIIKVDGNAFHSSDKFIEHVGKKKEGDSVNLTYIRKNKKAEVTIPVQKFKDDPSKVGVGITLVDDKQIIVDPDVKVKTDEIGGPSAGLMFSLEIYNQLTKTDLTRGYQIAGTGTISANGVVGPIGGIQQKIVAADKSGAEIFLAPNEKGIKGSNYQDAVKAAKDIGTKMKIVPIDTFDEAVEYLEGLKAKKG
ncbi:MULTISPECIES: SepM family pheromone-processing serine protease [unclassified Bacillus (in: firmicutes)]|uniref:SepM family pheromone-processing serine protease n=1 Tax=unclassified Bacillus (in: firmicutes) TaxID=185979 RepID=UPI0008F1967A|nr:MULTISPECIES: SepM family pheromone-processing serine protease [unclassified Bacillus (in: firmicutes)]SFA75756.1 PDZ domain-containing protein [Bacillus sp. UNCCL13]SFQ65820.1 PDZ domain-containing protein [Bacillus sp. cl95]